MDGREVEFGLFLPQIGMGWADLLERAKVAERVGFDSIWFMDHLATPGGDAHACFEGWTTATAIATATERIRIGHLVLCEGFRHPVLLAKMATTLDHISGGRLDLGLGWGSVPDELSRFGVGEGPPALRAARLRETLEVLDLLFSGERVDYQGRFFQLADALIAPGPLQEKIPIHIGGAGPKLTLPLVREFADWWNCISSGADRLAELRTQIGGARISIQRPISLARSEADREAAESLAKRRYAGWGGVVQGIAEEVAEALAEDVRSGAERVICVFADRAPPETLEYFSREVMPRVRAAV